MATTTTPLQEKLTLFWHGHFATANYKVADTRLMYLQNALFRSMATGNFRDLVQQMSLQPAMLIWLDNDPNEKGSPNENFARELMELFTLGVDQYTQDDVVASARAWTGHNTLDSDRTQYHFYPHRHDNGLKTFMGVTQNWDGPDIINFILRDDPTHKQIAARVHRQRRCGRSSRTRTPTTAIVTTLADAFLGADLSIAELVRAIFNHPAFLSAAAKQGLVRSPAEWVVACMRAVGMSADDANPQWWMADMGQQLFEPPNVSGWRPNEYWLTTSRVSGARELVALHHLAERRRRHAERHHRHDRARRGAARVRRARRRQPVGTHAQPARGVAHGATRRHARVDELVVHQPADARDAEPGVEPCLTRACSNASRSPGGASSRAARSTAGVVAVSPYLSRLEAFAAPPVADNQGILVTIFLSGGNDGLNMVAPVGDPAVRGLAADAQDRERPLGRQRARAAPVAREAQGALRPGQGRDRARRRLPAGRPQPLLVDRHLDARMGRQRHADDRLARPLSRHAPEHATTSRSTASGCTAA